jgi:leucyl/phenylalanyl-tRNA---protein transferase
MIPWLESANAFPPLELALSDPNGLLCAGGDLTPQRLINAYKRGIFPWYGKDEPILWWSPDPRMVLFPSEFKLSRSLQRTLRSGHHEVRLDSDFPSVIHACAKARRKGQTGTWITAEMQAAYVTLHELGYAHSVETWVDNELVGGLYGLAIGKMFYGESMFSQVSDASKIAFAHLACYVDAQGFGLIDCQMSTPHLASLGAREVPRLEFMKYLQKLTATDTHGRWEVDAASRVWK